MKLITTVVIFAFLFSCSLFAQEKTPNSKTLGNLALKPQNRVGFSVSGISGVGVNYLHIFDNKFAAKVVFIGSYNDEDKPQKEVYTSTGLEFQYNVYDSKIARIFPFVGLSYIYSDETSQNTDNNYSLTSSFPFINNTTYNILKTDIHRNFSAGFGFGLEILVGHRIAFNGEVGYKFTRKINSYSIYSTDPGTTFKYTDSQSRELIIAAGLGMSVAF